MKKNFCKVRRGHCLSLVWIVSFLLWGNVTMAALPIQEAKLSIQQRSVALSRVFYEIEKPHRLLLSLFVIMILI